MNIAKKRPFIKLFSIVILVAMFALLLQGCYRGKSAIDYSEWEVAFFDDFVTDTLDTAKWQHRVMQDGIRRAAYYSDDAQTVFIKDGNLVIRTAYKQGEYGAGWYTGWLETKTPKEQNPNSGYRGFSQKGGFFEIRCQVPPAIGIWSAFWLMPDEGAAFTQDDLQWTAKDGLEIDIMESPFFGFKQSKVIHVLHSDGYGSTLKTSKSKDIKIGNINRAGNMYNSMHTYALEWTEEEYIFYVDGKKTWQTRYKYQNKILGVSDVLQYLILSIEVGGHRNENTGELEVGIEKDGTPSWAGNPMDNDLTKTYDFIIDYVAVLKRK